MFRNSFITLAVTGSFFSSCKTVDLPVQEVQTPASSSWSAPTTNGKVPESRAWLTDFASPELTRLVDQAFANNLNLRASAARIRAAQSVVIQRNALRLPRLGVGVEAARADSRFSNPTSNFMLGPNVRWELDLWDRLSLQRDASSLDAEVLVNVDRGLRFSLAVAVVRNWCSLATNQLLLDLADETISNYLKTLRAVEDQVDGGIV